MILPFPKSPEDWLAIWQLTKTMTLLTATGDPITISVVSVTAFQSNSLGNLEAVKVEVVDGTFYISFGERNVSLNNQLVFQINSRDPKKGQWHIPQWYIDRCDKASKDKH